MGPKALPIVSGPTDDRSMETIIVGVDGSETSHTALQWALDHASTDDTVVVANAWSIPAAVGLEMPVASIVDYEVAAHRMVTDLVADLEVDDDGPKVTTHVGSGSAGKMLADLSAYADLVVVGSRGYGGVRSILLGSVSNHVVHHANCPVVVVPRTKTEDGVPEV